MSSGNLRSRAAYLMRSEGVSGLMAGAWRHLRALSRRVAYFERYEVYESRTEGVSPESLRPGIDHLEVVVLESEEDMRQLVSRGVELPPVHPLVQRSWLGRGGVAFCACVDGRLAHIQWLAMSAESRSCCDRLPYAVDFEGGVACFGGAYTWLRFRGLGIFTYVCGVRLKYLHDRGYVACRGAVRARNLGSRRAQAHWNPRLCEVAWNSRFLKWRGWRAHLSEPAAG